MSLKVVKEYLYSFIEPEKVKVYSSFFKTGKGDYAEGDKFLGISTPNTRRVVKKSKKLESTDIQELLSSEWHEERLLGLFILERRFRFASEVEKELWVEMYKNNYKNINNWDLVDQSADKILGEYCYWTKNDDYLLELANSSNLWEKRIAIIATYAYIKHKQTDLTYKIALVLMKDPHDLIQKAVGWMIRESGKRVDESEMVDFIRTHKLEMPRTMLRYAIERLNEDLKKELMQK
jgi:3-methyladenine DNA glycosylase AlkD